MLLKWDSISRPRTLVILDNFVQWLVVSTLLPETIQLHNQKGWFQGNMRIGLVLEVTTSFQHGKFGIEIRIWSVGQDNSQSWVRISYGTNKYVIESNHNNTEILADPPEDQKSQTSVKVIAARSKAKAKPQKREPVDTPSIMSMQTLIHQHHLSLHTKSRRE